jgi:hypothetical protein
MHHTPVKASTKTVLGKVVEAVGNAGEATFDSSPPPNRLISAVSRIEGFAAEVTLEACRPSDGETEGDGARLYMERLDVIANGPTGSRRSPIAAKDANSRATRCEPLN